MYIEFDILNPIINIIDREIILTNIYYVILSNFDYILCV